MLVAAGQNLTGFLYLKKWQDIIIVARKDASNVLVKRNGTDEYRIVMEIIILISNNTFKLLFSAKNKMGKLLCIWDLTNKEYQSGAMDSIWLTRQEQTLKIMLPQGIFEKLPTANTFFIGIF